MSRYQCPKCYGTVIETERRPNGESCCYGCSHKAPTNTFFLTDHDARNEAIAKALKDGKRIQVEKACDEAWEKNR